MGRALIKTFDVGEGDCIFFVLNNGGQRFSIMIDCGCYNDTIGNYIADELENRIDLLIITHIDEDHVIGIKDMLDQNNELKIDRIIFNCAQLTKIQPKDLPPSAKEAIENILKLKGKKKGKRKAVSAKQSLLLSNQIFKSEKLKAAWEKQKAYVTVASEPINLGDSFGSLTFLSPDEEQINKLDRVFKKAFVDNFYMKYEGPYTDESSLYELLMSDYSRPLSEIKKISHVGLSVQLLNSIASEDICPNISPTNKASIAFIWECNDKRVLFCGDADPQTIVYNFLRKHNINEGQYAFFDAIKVPHHGSAHNCGSNFWDTFDSENIFITGAKEWERPSRLCLAKIVVRPCVNRRNIRYTKSNKTIEWMLSDRSVMEELKYALTNDCEYGFDY